MDRELLETPKLVTLRNLEIHSLAIQKAMKYYDSTVASNVFIKAMIDAPTLAEDLRDLQRRFRQLQNEHYALKQEVQDYFDCQNKLLKLVQSK